MTIFLDQEDRENFLLASDCLHLKVLYHIITDIKYDANPWYADIENKEKIMNKLDISLATMNRQLAKLKSTKILVLEAKGKYKLNLNMLKL